MWAKGIPSLRVFLNVVIALAVFISTLTIFLALYTAITERTREIGILKSMGGSKSFIVGIVETEALLLASLGILLGGIVSLGLRGLIMSQTSLIVEFEWQWYRRGLIACRGGGNVRSALSRAQSRSSGSSGGPFL